MIISLILSTSVSSSPVPLGRAANAVIRDDLVAEKSVTSIGMSTCWHALTCRYGEFQASTIA